STIYTKIHTLRLTIYKIITSRKSFYSKTEKQERIVKKLINKRKYPNINRLPLRDVIVKC
ncbi:hypothetical protein K469DRAFT_590173, partial [Zopfia rhizophila CBS 207.26]